jgi:hypothetical protein
MSFIKERPVVFWGLLTSVVSSVIGLLLIFNAVSWTGEQVGAIMLAISAFGAVFTFVVQGQVTPTNNPKDSGGNMLTPGTIGNDENDLPPI